MSILYQREIYIPFHLGDAAGILFFGHVFSLAHEVYEFFVQEKLNISWTEWFNHPKWIVPIKQTQASYQLPLQIGKTYLVSLSLKQMRTSSFVLVYQFSQKGQIFCEVETVHVFCDKKTFQKCFIPVFIKDKFECIE